jgi:hypothetical protein
MSTHTRATIEDLYNVQGKAELVQGEIVEMPPAGDWPGRTYKASAPDNPIIFRRGDLADAEPAVPGWHIPVDALFT